MNGNALTIQRHQLLKKVNPQFNKILNNKSFHASQAVDYNLDVMWEGGLFWFWCLGLVFFNVCFNVTCSENKVSKYA